MFVWRERQLFYRGRKSGKCCGIGGFSVWQRQLKIWSLDEFLATREEVLPEMAKSTILPNTKLCLQEALEALFQFSAYDRWYHVSYLRNGEERPIRRQSLGHPDL